MTNKNPIPAESFLWTFGTACSLNHVLSDQDTLLGLYLSRDAGYDNPLLEGATEIVIAKTG